MRNKLKTITALAMMASSWVHAADLYVSPNGSDANRGNKAAPVASLQQAKKLIRSHAGKMPITVHVADGVYHLPETLVFTPADSGTEKAPILYRAENEGGAVLSGGSELDLSWTPYQDGIYQAKTAAGLMIDQLFIDGQNQRMARYPNYDASKKTDAYQGYAADAFSKERAAGWADPTGGYIHAMHRSQWGGYHYLITGKDAAGEVTYEGGWQNNRKSGMHDEFRMVENIFEELDASGEWFHNQKTNTLYYKPAADVNLATATVEVVRLRNLVEFEGSSQAPVKHISLQGFVVRHAARTFMDTKEQLVRSDWAIYRGGAFMLTGTEDVSILDCEFDQVGGNAIFVNNYNRRTLIKGCHIHDTGASGVCFVGDPDAVYNPLFEYGQKNDLATIDRTPGPKTDNYPALGTVEDCLIHGIGRTERQPAGVMMDMASEITVRDTSIYDTARSGINIGDGAWGGHLIERCDVFDTVLETHDHGSFNSWGRDRYWRADHLTASQAAVDAEPTLPFLDAIKTTVIRDSRWRCEHGWDIDLDDGSSNYDIYNNLMLCGGLKLREGFRRRAWNNVIINNGLSSHVWFNNSNDAVYSNIMARASGPYIQQDVKVTDLVDRNFYYQSNQQTLDSLVEKFGWDKNSLVGDPLFVDPARGDFSVQAGSPAFKVGFENFPMDQFGVKKPSLKAIAQTPSFGPKPKKQGAATVKAAPVKAPANALPAMWLGAMLHSITGNEFSAYGVTEADGGVALQKVAAGSAAAQAGLAAGDLIQGVNGNKVSNVAELFSAVGKVTGTFYEVKVIRNQEAQMIRVAAVGSVVMEDADQAEGFTEVGLPQPSRRRITTNRNTSDDPLTSLLDGQLGDGYGAIFTNGVTDGLYKMDLGQVQPVTAISSWSSAKGATRVQQKLQIYVSDSKTDPGWDLSRYTDLRVIDTIGSKASKYKAVSLRAAEGQTLGDFRWVIWSVSPVYDRGGGENTAFQELSVETVLPELKPETVVQSLDAPNIVFLMTDDQRWDTLGCYGRPEFRTDHIDKLAAQGVIFDNAFQAVAICAPSRATIMTGRYFASHKAGFTYPFDVKLTPDDFDDTYPARLKEAGYRTGFIGKFNIYTQGVNPARYFDYYAVNRTFIPKDDAVLKNIFHADRDPKERTIKKGDALIHFLDTQPKGQPFCVSVSFDAVKNDKDADMYGPHTEIFKDQVFSVPGNWAEGANETLPDVVKNNARGFWLHKAKTSTPELYQTLARRFATQGYTVDQQVGRVMAKLEEMGVLDNTIVIYTSDNGRFHGSQGLFDKCILYEEAVKAPLIVFDGRVAKEKRGRRESALISSVDVAPTILSMANVAVPERMQGLEITGILDQTQDMSVWRDAVFMENLFLQDMFTARINKVEDLDAANNQLIADNKSYRSRGVRTERFKYFVYNEHNPVIEELYDLENDPLEQDNLVSNPEYASVLADLRTRTEELFEAAKAD